MADTWQGAGPSRHTARSWAWQTHGKGLGLADTKRCLGRHTERSWAWQTHCKELGLADTGHGAGTGRHKARS